MAESIKTLEKKKKWSHVADVLVRRNALLARIFFHDKEPAIVLDYDKLTAEYLAREDRRYCKEKYKRWLELAEKFKPNNSAAQ